MKRYRPHVPHVAFGLFAAAMSAFTIALAVVVPASMDVGARHERMVASSNANAAPRAAHADATARDARQG